MANWLCVILFDDYETSISWPSNDDELIHNIKFLFLFIVSIFLQSLADTVSCIMEGVLSPSVTMSYYDSDVVKLLYELLKCDSTDRPDTSIILSHPFILPFVLNSNSQWFKSDRKVLN